MISIFLILSWWVWTAATDSPTVADLVDDRLLIPVQEAARLLSCNRSTLYRKFAAGVLDLTRVGSRTYVTSIELRRYLTQEMGPPRDRKRDPTAPHFSRKRAAP